MKKVSLLLFALAMTITSFSQSIFSGKTPYVSGSFLTSSAPFSYSVEAGMWGTTSPTSFGISMDFIRIGEPIETTKWLGIKWYKTFYQNKTSNYMFYLAPKTNIDFKEGSAENMVEIGINPCYEINKHMFMSVSLCDQIFDDQNDFKKSIWHPGVSVGLVLYK